MGSFDRVSDIQPWQIVPIEIFYPKGRRGEKVVLSVEDGGTFDNNKRVKVLPLDSQNKISFNFRVAGDEGIYTITLSKGNDTKEVKLWVGSERS
ncbi:MAG: hypothetical protein WKG06_47240 [Segetibacter sp.]